MLWVYWLLVLLQSFLESGMGELDGRVEMQVDGFEFGRRLEKEQKGKEG
jgi:hypothetical protein